MGTKFEPIAQDFEPATGLGLLEASRGDDHVLLNGQPLVGEYTVTGDEWIPEVWVAASEAGTAWSGDDAWGHTAALNLAYTG